MDYNKLTCCWVVLTKGMIGLSYRKGEGRPDLYLFKAEVIRGGSRISKSGGHKNSLPEPHPRLARGVGVAPRDHLQL